MGIHMAIGGDRGHELISMDPGCGMVMDPDMALGCISGLDVTMASDGSASHSDKYGSWRQHRPGYHIALTGSAGH